MKINISIIATICIGFILTSSCKKIAKDRIDATILVKQYKTNAPIVDAMVLISRGKPPGGFGFVIVDTIYTDANGYAKYEKHIDPDYMYYAQAVKENYFPNLMTEQVDVRAGIRNFETYLVMYAKSYVKVHIKNINPYNQYDVFWLSSFGTTHYFQGNQIDTTVLWCYEFDNDCLWQGDYYRSIGNLVQKNDIQSNKILSFSPIPFDTTIVEALY